MQPLTFHDGRPPLQSFRDAVIEGLSREHKAIPPKYFYDERGSRLFDSICQQPEYYPPAVESRLLNQLAPELPDLVGSGALVIEPGAGSAVKVRLLINALQPRAFVPMDISFDYLRVVATQLAGEFGWLPVHAVCADFSHSLPIPDVVPRGRRLLFFPGSTLGNLEPHEALRFLHRVRGAIGHDGMLLIGVDTKKEEALLNAAYNDAAGVTAQFNLNLLHRMRRELGARLNADGFEHRAFYNRTAGRVEMHLVSAQQQRLQINGCDYYLEKGESLHTENSYKYTPDEFLQLADKGGFRSIREWLDQDGMFAVFLLAAG